MPDTISFTPFNHFQRFETAEGFIGFEEPLSDRVSVHDLREAINDTAKFGQSTQGSLTRSSFPFDFRQLPFGDSAETRENRPAPPQRLAHRKNRPSLIGLDDLPGEGYEA